MVDDESLDGSASRLELEAEIIVERFNKCRSLRIEPLDIGCG